MATTLQGIPHVICYIDDILLTGKDDDDHLHNLADAEGLHAIVVK